MLVLEGNNPRFSWEPSATMLTYRLNGTTERTVSNRDRQRNCALQIETGQRPVAAHNLRSSRRAPKKLCVADQGFSAARSSQLVLTWSFAR
jgi:hypothetical protein